MMMLGKFMGSAVLLTVGVLFAVASAGQQTPSAPKSPKSSKAAPAPSPFPRTAPRTT